MLCLRLQTCTLEQQLYVLQLRRKRPAVSYHWLPQVSFSSRQKFCRDKHVFVTTKHIFCRDKSMLVATKLLSRQIYVTTNIILSRERFCLEKRTFFATKDVFCRDRTCVCRDKSMLAATKLLSRPKHFLLRQT